MTIKKIAEILGKSEQTIHNWKKTNPKLFEVVYNYFNNSNNFSNCELKLSEKEKELIESYRELNEEEKNLYYYEIKARALRKKLN